MRDNFDIARAGTAAVVLSSSRRRCPAWTPARAGDHPPFSARSGLDLARDAARRWAPDARLVYLENDEPVAEDGTAVRWGYLF